MKNPVKAWMPLYTADWDSDTAALTCEQDGAYGRLVRHYWRNGAPADDDVQIASIVRMNVRDWRKIRPILSRFFVIENGVWFHGRVEDELAKWAEKKRLFIERAASGGRAKAAKSTRKALLNGCTSPSSTVEGTPNSVPSHSGGKIFLGPKEVRSAFVAVQGEDWTVSYIDPCGWQDVPERGLIAATGHAETKITREGRAVLLGLGLRLIARARSA